MLTIVRGSVSPSADDVYLSNGDSVQEFYDDYAGTGGSNAGSYDIGTGTSIWTGALATVNMTGLAGFDPTKIKYVNYQLDLESGTFGSGWVMVFPYDSKIVTFQTYNQQPPNTLWARVDSTPSTIRIFGQAVFPQVEDFKIVEIRQAP